jgi:hypothetical protein
MGMNTASPQGLHAGYPDLPKDDVLWDLLIKWAHAREEQPSCIEEMFAINRELTAMLHAAIDADRSQRPGVPDEAARMALEALEQSHKWIAQQMLDNGCPPDRLLNPPEGSHLFNTAKAISTLRTHLGAAKD